MKQPEIPLVSIITPVFNGAAFLDNLILSVYNQDYPRIEHIIIDDGSRDNGATVNILKKYSHLRWWSRPNEGQYATMNEGLDAANGDVVCFISADDLVVPGAVRKIVEFLLEHPQSDGVYGKYNFIDEHNSPYWYQPLITRAPITLYPYIPFIAHCSLYIRKNSLISRGLYFDPTLRYTSDYEWITRLTLCKLKIEFIKQVLSQVRWHAAQTSHTKISLIKTEQMQVWKKLHVNPLIFKIINIGIDWLLVAKQLFISASKPNRSVEIRRTISWLAGRRKK